MTDVKTKKIKPESIYIHGTHSEEQARLSLLNHLTNGSFIDFIEIKPGDSVLEVGSGLGILADSVAIRFPESSLTGIEIAPEMIKKARMDFSNTPNLKFIEGDALSLSFDDASFDVVYCRYILEHATDPAKALREIFRVLKNGGRFFVQENNIFIYALYPDCPTFFFVLGKLAEIQSRMGGDAEIGKKLYSLIKQAGFRSINLSIVPEVHHYDMPTFDPWIVNSREIVKGARERLAALDGISISIIEKAIDEIDNLRKNPYASAYFYWNRASAVKP